MIVDLDLIAKIAAPTLGAAAGILLARLIEKRPRLITYLGHVSAFTLRTDQPSNVHTHSIIVANVGRLPANNVRVGHYFLPPNHQVIPSVQHDVINLPSGGSEIHFPNIVPGEQVTVSYLYFPPITWNQINSYIKSDEGLARVLNAIPTPQYPRWIIRILWGFVLLGIITVTYFLMLIGLRIAVALS